MGFVKFISFSKKAFNFMSYPGVAIICFSNFCGDELVYASKVMVFKGCPEMISIFSGVHVL